MAIPWPDKSMHCIALYVNGNDIHGRMIRRTLMRYLNLTLILVLRSISSAVKRRFPTLEHVVESGFMTSVELEMYQSVPSAEFNTYWIPCTWFISLLKESKKSSRITDAQGLKIIMEEFNEFRSKCGLLWSYDWVSIPLVYTQVVTIATYSFFLAAVIGRQYVETARKPFQLDIDKYIPVFTILQFFFFMGLLKVAEQLINPFGDDDEDFELNWLIDRHTKVSYLGVDTLMMRSPPLVKDMYFDESDLTLPYTEAAVAYKKKTYRGSVHNMEVPEEKHIMFLPEITEEDDDKEKPPTPRSSILNLQQLGTATAAGSWRARRPSCQSSIVDISSPALEKDLPVSSLWRSSLTRSDSAASKKHIISSNVKTWPSSSTLARSENSLKNLEPESFNGVDKQSMIVQLQEKNIRKDSDIGSVEGLKFNVGSGEVGLSLHPHFEKSQENVLFSQCSKETKNKYLSSSRENLNHALPKKTMNITWPKIVASKHKLPLSSTGKKKGVRWKTVLDDNSEKRKTIDLAQTLSQILDADEDYVHEQEELARDSENFKQEDLSSMKYPIFCSRCKGKITKSELISGMDLASGKLTASLKKLLIYRPINYVFKTKSCPDLAFYEKSQGPFNTNFHKVSPLQNKHHILEQLKCDSKNIHERFSDIQLVTGKSISLPLMKFNLPVSQQISTNYSFNSLLIENSNNIIVPSTSANTLSDVTEDESIKPFDLSLAANTSDSVAGTMLKDNDPELIETSVNDISWQSADWTTLLSSRAPSIELIPVYPLNESEILSDLDPCNATLQEVIVNLDRQEQNSNLRRCDKNDI